MARLARSTSLPEYGTFHVTARGVDRCVIYRDATDYIFFMSIFKRVCEVEKYRVEAYCLMPNHLHAVIETELERLSRGLQRVLGVFAQGFNARHGRSGHLFQGRYHARLVDQDDYLGTACEYVWNNPVRAKLCAEAHHWPWSGRILRARGVDAGAHQTVERTAEIRHR